ncbi:MAG: hypothetical protein NT007_00575 [Candidatus Kapabacteria bacterium]|nr:hypothetical protein [Candidatus Kapabacteria bacterium]
MELKRRFRSFSPELIDVGRGEIGVVCGCGWETFEEKEEKSPLPPFF